MAPTEATEMFRDNDDNNVVIHARLDPFIGTVFRDPDGKPWVHWEGEAPKGGTKLFAAPVVQRAAVERAQFLAARDGGGRNGHGQLLCRKRRLCSRMILRVRRSCLASNRAPTTQKTMRATPK